MEFLTSQTRAMEGARNNQAVTLHGAVHALRDLGGVTFLTLRTRERLVQCVCTGREALDGATEECTVTATGVLRARAPGPRRGGAVRGEDHGAHPARRAPAGAPGQEEAGPEPGHRAVPAAGGAPRPQGAGGVPHPGRRLPGLPGVPGRGGLHRDPHPQDRPRRGGGGRQHLPAGLLWQKGLPGPVPPVLQADHGGGVRAGVRGGPGVPGGEARHPAAPQRVHLPGL